MIARFILCFAIVMSGLTAVCHADQITLKNGDRLTGNIVKSDGKALVLKSEFAGDVTVKWDAIQEITSSQPLYFELKNGKKVSGPVHTEAGALAVGGGATPVSVPLAEVTLIRSQSEETAYEKSLHPGILEQWKGGATVGFAVTSGNSETENLSLAFNAARKTAHDGITMYANSVYAADNAPGATPNPSADSDQGGVRYDRNFAPRVFGFGTADFQADALQTLDLRSILGGGLGWHAIKNSGTTFDVLGGFAYTHEHYDTKSDSFPAALIGEELSHKLVKSTLITEKFYFAPDLTDTVEYRTTFNFGTITKISKWFAWQNAFGDIYVTNPPMDKKKNDLQVTSGLTFSFAH